jgi:hypothetical protein
MNLTLRTLDRAGVHLWLPVFTSLLEKEKKMTAQGQKSISKEGEGTSVLQTEPTYSSRSIMVSGKGQKSPVVGFNAPQTFLFFS